MGRVPKVAGYTGRRIKKEGTRGGLWAAVHQAIARRMLSYLDNSEAQKVPRN